jgi:hypothetical protein
VTCRWDTEAADYLTDGEPCRHDDYGDPTRHCTTRRTCAQHVGPNEQTCARCLGRTRTDVRQIVERAALMLPEAMITGVNSEAANLAGPAADPEAWSWRKVAAMQGRAWHLSQDEDDDDWHPQTVLTRWAWRITHEYGLPSEPDVWTIGNAAKFLDGILGKVAQDQDQDFPLLARELRKCRAHLEAVLRDSMTPERGAPCPTCSGLGTFVRLTREYAHWCTDEDCDRFHFDTDEADVWRCPRNVGHVWDLESYSRWVEERKAVAG